jgi:apolipoprotein N-acyltransferase
VYVSINTYGHAPPWLAGGLTAGFVLLLALFPALTFALFAWLRRPSPMMNALLFIAIWVLGDAFRTVFLTGFPWLFLGYGHLDTALAGWIPVLGIYGITGIVVATGTTLLLLVGNATSGQKLGMAIVVALLWLTGPLLNRVDWVMPRQEAPLSVALVQTNIAQEVKWLPQQRKLTLRLLKELSFDTLPPHDLIVWPETAVPILHDQALAFLDQMGGQAKAQGSTIISGIPYRERRDDGGITMHNSIVSIGAGTGLYHKQKLVPFGEYVPLQDYLRGLIAFFDLPMSDFRVGPARQPLLQAGSYKVAPYICYEVVYPDFAATLAREADYLLTISNDSWFGRSIGPIQHLEMAQFRAAENRKYMVRGTNNGVTAVIDPRGLIQESSERFVETVLSSHIYPMQGLTPFARFGSLPALGLCGLFVLGVLLAGLNSLRKNR